jgi:uncharacterized membrane-anchored protein YjiN (DUF445 family)
MAEPDHRVDPATITSPRRRQRNLALAVLLLAAALAILAFPFRATWWGGWILAIAEAGVVGGLADWFAVTALFRRPLGLPIPHTALIPANWQLMAARVGTMVGDRVLTTEYVTREIAQVDVAGLLARAAGSVETRDVQAVVGAVARWTAGQLPPESAAELVGWLRRLVLTRPASPILADLVDIARRHGWDERAVDALAGLLVKALERPDVRNAVGELVDGVVGSYRRRMGVYPSILIGVANMFGLIDRDRLVAALHSALRKVAADPADPLRQSLSQVLAELPGRLRNDPQMIARVETAKQDLLTSAAVAQLIDDAAAALHRALVRDLGREDSGLVRWITEEIERMRKTLIDDEALRADLDRWAKRQGIALVERYQDRLAAFIEGGVHALGAEGAVRLIEEQAGDDLQYIRVNGTVVGGLAGGAIYAIHLLLRA